MFIEIPEIKKDEIFMKRIHLHHDFFLNYMEGEQLTITITKNTLVFSLFSK